MTMWIFAGATAWPKLVRLKVCWCRYMLWTPSVCNQTRHHKPYHKLWKTIFQSSKTTTILIVESDRNYFTWKFCFSTSDFHQWKLKDGNFCYDQMVRKLNGHKIPCYYGQYIFCMVFWGVYNVQRYDLLSCYFGWKFCNVFINTYTFRFAIYYTKRECCFYCFMPYHVSLWDAL